MNKSRVSKTAQVNLMMLADLGIEEAVHFQSVLQFSPGALSSLRHLPMASKLPACISMLSEILYQRTNEMIFEQDNPVILDLACGYSPRVLKAGSCGKVYVGVDLPDVIEELSRHREELTKDMPGRRSDYYSVDLTKYDELAALTDKLQAPVTVVTQALLTYLTLEQKQVLISNIKSLPMKNKGCWIIPDAAPDRLLPELLSAVMGNDAYAIYKQLMKIVDAAVKRDRTANGWQTADEILNALDENGFMVERVPLYTDSLVLKSLQQVSPGTAAEVIKNLRNTNALIVKVRENMD